jgi:segregation and condensation protein B
VSKRRAGDEGRVVPFPGADPEATALVPALEALLFAAGEPVSVRALADALDARPDEIAAGLLALRARLAAGDRGLELVEAGGWQLRTDPRFAGPVLELLGATPQRLSRAALEVLSVVAYRQPVTRVEIEALRGVSCGGVLKALLDRGLVRAAGHRDEPGRPLQYATTGGFLELFGLPDLSALPTLKGRDDLDGG